MSNDRPKRPGWRGPSWTPAEIEILRIYYRGAAAAARAAEMLPRRSIGSIYARAVKEGLSERRPQLSGAEVAALRRHYPSGGSAAVMAVAPRLSKRQVQEAAGRLGLRRVTAGHVDG